MTFVFEDNLNTGICEIDEQHKKLIDTIQVLKNANLNKEKIIDIVVELRASVTGHFATEESYMEKLEYPLLEEHKAFHMKMLKNYNDLLLRLAENGSLDETIGSLVELLGDWVEEHSSGNIKDVDVHMAEFFRQKLDVISRE